MYYACPYSQTVQYSKNKWNIVEATSVLTLPMTTVTVKQLIGILIFFIVKAFIRTELNA